jgi:eukaryotic-like serine/threonine-protein kinase
MTEERYRRICELYNAALGVDADKRGGFLDRMCAGDSELRHEVESLINSHLPAEDLIATESLGAGAELFATREKDLCAGQIIARYRVLSLIGTGGMGRVYSAEDTALDRRVALKLLPESFTNDKNRMQRFHQEARAASALNHPNILTVYEVGRWLDREFIATEFVEGVTLRKHMRKQLPLVATIDIALQVASALTTAHAAGIIHRDIKPENIMLRPDGLVKVLDFGLAKYVESRPETQTWLKTATGVVVGTTAYMSPEQARGQEVDARTDIWSLGVVLYEMLAGRLPFPGKTPTDRLVAIVEREPPSIAKQRGGIPFELETIINRALAKNKDERYARATDLLEDLRRLRTVISDDRSFRFALPVAKGITFYSRNRRSTRLAIALLLFITVTGVAVFSYFRLSSRQQSQKGASATVIDSIAVLPLANTGGSSEVEYLSDGITESVINQISQLPSLKVMSRNSVFRFKGQSVDAQQVSKLLGVSAVMMGNLKRLDDQLVINVELIDARDASVIWSHQYIRKVADVIDLQNNVAQDVTENLRFKLSGPQQQQLAKHQTDNVEAYELYLKGLYFWNKNRRTPDDFQKSIEYFQQAINLDPNFALAYVGLANCYIQQTVYIEIPSKETLPKALAAATKALELNDTVSEAHSTLAEIKMLSDWDRSGTETEVQRALELNPNNPWAYHYYGAHFTALGRFDEAIINRKAALQRDPLSAPKRAAFGWTLYFAGRYDESIAECREALAIEENFFRAHLFLGLNYERKGMFEQAIAEMKKALNLANENAETLASLAHVYTSSGNRVEAQRILSKLSELSKQRYVNPYFFAVVYAGLGQKDQAMKWLGKAVEDRSVMLLWLKIEPRFKALHSDPRFQNLLQRVHLS